MSGGVPPHRTGGGIRLAVLDDNPHLSWQGRVHPVNATFHRFLAALLDLPGSPVATIDHCVPLRPATEPPPTLPLDPRLRVVATAPFDGIAGYLRRAPLLAARNARVLRPVIARADLLWLKLPASNGLLAAALAVAARTPRFGYVAGSAADVAQGQRRGRLGGVAARLVGEAYDAAGGLASAGAPRVIVGRGLVDGGGVVTSLVEESEVLDRSGQPWPSDPEALRLAWAGRLAEGKGLEALLAGLAGLAGLPGQPADRRVELVILGDGPARARLEELAAQLGVADHVTWRGYIAERAPYLAALAATDLFVFPSPAEGFPKVVLDAMAVGVPVVAAPSGELGELAAAGIIEPLPAVDGAAVARAVRSLHEHPEKAVQLRADGAAFAARHTRAAEAARLVELWRERYPGLPWLDG
ncbi:MAG TPA: glycosyltransferase [Candidatus Limnocylindrales bacterium]|nr:glycosyltransferase [Candidatus Limnocylindrales bacterium]